MNFHFHKTLWCWACFSIYTICNLTYKRQCTVLSWCFFFKFEFESFPRFLNITNALQLTLFWSILCGWYNNLINKKADVSLWPCSENCVVCSDLTNNIQNIGYNIVGGIAITLFCPEYSAEYTCAGCENHGP